MTALTPRRVLLRPNPRPDHGPYPHPNPNPNPNLGTSPNPNPGPEPDQASAALARGATHNAYLRPFSDIRRRSLVPCILQHSAGLLLRLEAKGDVDFSGEVGADCSVRFRLEDKVDVRHLSPRGQSRGRLFRRSQSRL